MDRPSWGEYFMGMARHVATRSTCMSRQVGAILVRKKRVLTTGYNGAPRWVKHCRKVGCVRRQKNIPSGQRHELCRGLHAEQNAIIQAGLHGVSTKDATMYVTHQPCIICAKMVINAGVDRVVMGEGYPDEMAREMLDKAGVTLSQGVW